MFRRLRLCRFTDCFELLRKRRRIAGGFQAVELALGVGGQLFRGLVFFVDLVEFGLGDHAPIVGDAQLHILAALAFSFERVGHLCAELFAEKGLPIYHLLYPPN